MAIYLISFFISCMFLKLSESIKKSKVLRFLVVFIALMIPCVVAGMRAQIIGTDIEVYVKPLFECAKKSTTFSRYFNMSWRNSWKAIYVYSFESGFSTFIYLITMLTKSLQGVLFFIHFIIIIPIYLGLRKFKDLKNSTWFGMLVFYLMIYNVTLNLMRQYISIAIVFYGTSCLLNDKNGKFKFFVYLIIAYLFHSSALLGLFIYIFYCIFHHQYYKNRVLKISEDFKVPINHLLILGIVFAGIIMVMNSDMLVKVLEILGFDYYSKYIAGDVTFLVSKIIKIMPIILLFIITYRYFIKKYPDSYFYILMFVMDVLISQFSSVNAYGVRIGYLFQTFSIVSFPLLCNSHPQKLINKLIKLLLIIYLIVYWYYYFVYSGSNETVPYIPYWKF